MKSNYIKNILLSATIIGSISLSSTSGFAETKIVNNYSELTNAIIQGTTSDIQLGSDINSFTKNIKLNQANTIVNIDGNDKTISGGNLLGFDVQNGSTLSISDATVSGFQNSGWGSAIFNAGKLTLENVTFDGNKGIQGYVDGAVSNYTESQKGVATAELLGAMKFTNNYGKNVGGAIYNSGTMTIDSKTQQAIFQSNNSGKYGGAIFNKADLDLKGNILLGDESDSSLGNNANNAGGAIYNEGNITSNSELILGNNTSRWEGGAIRNVGSIKFENTANKTAKFVKNSSIQGGAISNSGTIDSNQDLVFEENIAQGSEYNSYGYSYGGAIYNAIGGNIRLNGSNTFKGNSSKVSSGGAISNSGEMRIYSQDTKFISNTAKSTGGAIYNDANGTLILDGNFDFTENVATLGGAIHNKGQMNLDGKFTFDGNTATTNGGAIYNEAGNLIINGTRDISGSDSVTFKNNRLTSTSTDTHGGAIYIRGNENKYAYLDITGADFENNESRSHGGAIYVDQYVKFNIENTIFNGNKVGASLNELGWGGAIGLDSSKDSVYGYVKNSKFTGNYAGDAGGAIPAGTGLTIVNSEFYGNHAVCAGGAISYDPKGILSDKSLKIIADGGDTVFGGNWVGKSNSWSSDGSNSEGLYIGNSINQESWTDVNDSNIYFNAGNQGKIIFNDTINALGNSKDEKREKYITKTRNQYTNPNIQLNQDITYSRYENGATETKAPTKGTIVINNQVKGANLVLHDGVLTFGQANDKQGYINPTQIDGFKYFSVAGTEPYYVGDGKFVDVPLAAGRITLKGGALDLINGTIESKESGIFNPENINVIGNANLRLDLDLGNDLVDYIDSEIKGSGTLTIDKISFEEGTNTDSFNVGDTKNLQFANKNLLDANNTILESSLRTVITSNAGYTLQLAQSDVNNIETRNNSIAVTKVISAGGLPVAVSLGQETDLADNRTYIYNATADEKITNPSGENSWDKGYQISLNGTTYDRTTSNVLKGKMLQINGNGKNVFTTDGIIGIEVGEVTRVTGNEAQQLIINDVKKSDNSGGWSGFNSALINNGGEITLNNSIFSNNKSTEITKNGNITKEGNGGAVYNQSGTVNINNTDFTANSATGNGGAIYNAGTVNIVAADGNTVKFDGNTANGVANDIYNSGTLNLAAAAKSSILFNGGISGDSSNKGLINVGYTNNANIGNVIFNNTVANQNISLNSGTLQLGANATAGRDDYFQNSSLEMNGGTLNAQNNYIDTIKLDNFTNNSTNSTLLFDVDLSGSSAIGDNIVVSDSGSVSSPSAIKIGLINVVNGFTGNKDSASIQFINKAVNSYMDEVDQNIIINDVIYKVNANQNYITITKAGQSGGFAYEVINSNYDRTFVVTSNDDSSVDSTIVNSWIDGNNKLGGSIFSISGGSYGNKLISENNLIGIEVNDNQKLNINGVKSYTGFNSAVINNGGEINVNGTTFESNNANQLNDVNGNVIKTANGGVIQNNGGTVNVASGTNGTNFTNNTATGLGGAIYNAADAVLNFNSIDDKEISFNGNTDQNGKNDIYNAGTINVSGQGDLVIGSGIAGNGTINSSGNIVLNSDNSKFTGVFNQIADTTNSGTTSTITVNNGGTLLGGTNNIKSGTLNWNSSDVNAVGNGILNIENGAGLVVGNGGKFKIIGDNIKIDTGASIAISQQGNLIVAKDMTINKISGVKPDIWSREKAGTLTADNAKLTFNNNTILPNDLKFASQNNATAIIDSITNVTNANNLIDKIVSGNNSGLTLDINGTNTNSDIIVDGTNIANLNFSGDNIQYGGKISGTAGTVTNSGNLTITGNQKDFTGTFEQNSGSTTFDISTNLFGGIKNINGGTLTINGGTVDYSEIMLGNSTILNQAITATTAENRANLTSSAINFTGANASANFTGGNINLSRIDNGSSNTISFDGSNIKLTDTDFTGSTIYNFKDSEIDLIENDGTTKDYKFDNVKTDNTKLSFNININRNDTGNTISTDTISINNSDGNDAIFKFGNIYISGEENGQRGDYSSEKDTLQGNAKFDNGSTPSIIGGTTSWIYDITHDDNSVQLSIKDYASSSTLNDMNKLSGKRFFQFTEKADGDTYHIANSLDDMAGGEFSVRGSEAAEDKSKYVLSGILDGTTDQKGSFFNITGNEETNFTVSNVTIKDASKNGNGSVISNNNNNATINIINTIISGNTATGNGGAIYNNANKVTASGDEETNLIISNTVFNGNKADGLGGAIYNAGAMTVTDSSFETSTDTIYLTNSSNTLFAGTNTINSGISSESPTDDEAAAIWNNGILNLNGDNSGYKGEYYQENANAITNVLGKFFDGDTIIENGTLNWLTDESASGHFEMTGGNLNIGDANHQSALDLSGDSKIESSAIVRINGNSGLGINDNATVNLNDNDIWLGDIELNDNGTLNLDNITNYTDATLTANSGNLNINNGTLIIGENSTIQESVATNIKTNATLQVNEGGEVTIGSSSNWEGKTILNGGDLTVKGLTSNGIIQAGTGNLTVDSGKLTVGENSAIASAVTTIINPNATLDITNGGYAHLGTDDTLGGKVTLNGGTLDYAMITRQGESNIIIANTGNLNLLENSVMDIKSPSVIAKDVVVDIQKGSTVNVRSGAELNLDSQDKWNGLVATWTNGILKTDGVDNTKIGGQLQQNRGTSIFDNKSNILIDGQDNYIVGGNVSILNNSTLHLGSGVDNFNVTNLNMSNNSLLNTMNNQINKYETTNMNVDGINNVSIDVSPRDRIGDTFIINNLNGTNSGTLNISDFNFIGLAPVDRNIKLQVFDTQNINDVNFTAGDKKIFTPIGNYQMFSQGGGAYTASLVDYNPQVYRGQVATIAAYNHQLLIDDMLTNHFILPNERLIDKAAQANKTSSTSPLFAPYQSTIDDGNIWTKTYVSFETLSMTNNLKVGNNVYGTLIGADLPAVKLKKGWKFIPTAYIGYNGGNQNFNNVDMYQNGGQGGFMGTFIKNNFIGSIAAYGGGYFNEMNVAGNTDHTGNWFAGTAAKAAYNIHATKHFIVQPTAFISYNIFGKQNWGTDYGSMSMNSGTLNGINVAPGMNLIYSRNTWSVYGTIQYMFNINDQVGGKAGNVNLPKTEMRHGYINYGIGATKTWKDRLSSYFQINLRNGGRTGIGFQLGLNYLFDWGKPKKKTTTQTTPIKPEKKVIKSLK